MAGTDFGDEAPKVWHKTRLRVPLYEVDLGHAVYHGNYFHLLELAREGFLRDLGYPYRRFMDEQLHLTVVEASCSYWRSLRYDIGFGMPHAQFQHADLTLPLIEGKTAAEAHILRGVAATPY